MAKLGNSCCEIYIRGTKSFDLIAIHFLASRTQFVYVHQCLSRIFASQLDHEVEKHAALLLIMLLANANAESIIKCSMPF